MKRSTKIILAIIYFFWPLDVIPDLLVGPGWLDDVAVLAYAFMSADEEEAATA